MTSIPKKLLFSTCSTLLFFACFELYLQNTNYEGTSIVDIVGTSGFEQNSYVHQRDRILGDWYLKTPNGYRSNPALLERGFHRESFLNTEPRIFAMGGSTTYGSPFEHDEKGFPERLQKKLNGQYRVINAGVAGMDSSAFLSMSKQLSNIGGRGVIIYTGNNEIRGGLLRSCLPKSSKHPFSEVRIYRWLQDSYRRFAEVKYSFDVLAEHQEDCIKRAIHRVTEEIPTSYDATRSDPFYEQLTKQFKENIQMTVNTFTSVHMEVWLVIPPINLEQPPVYAHPNPILSHETKSLINNLVQKKQWTSILLLDQTHAKANYELGIKTQDKNKLIIAAQRDYATQRITPAFQDILLEICETNPKTVTCIDLRHIQEDNTSQFFHDFCHPTRTFGVDSIANSLLQHIE